MKCEKCGSTKVNIIDSRIAPWNKHNITRRIRVCPVCKNRFATFELTVDDIKNIDKRGPFIKRV